MKRFIEWIGLKEKVHDNVDLPVFQEREIWWTHLGENVGHEEDGKGESFTRPFIIVKKFNKELLFGIPCSSVNKKNKYYFDIYLEAKKFKTSALLSQARTISARRLTRRIEKMGNGVFKRVKMALIKAIFT